MILHIPDIRAIRLFVILYADFITNSTNVTNATNFNRLFSGKPVMKNIGIVRPNSLRYVFRCGEKTTRFYEILREYGIRQYLRHPVRRYNPAFSVQNLNAHFIGGRYVREILKLLPQKPDPILIQEMGCRITKIGSINIG